ncbi:MAG: hypothetical protein WD118_07340 [Phycisphaeraceae bacterium]
MAADQHELALRYLLQLSSDIRSAMLLRGGDLLAAAPSPALDASVEAASELVRMALDLRNGEPEAVELDVLCESEAVYVIARDGIAMVCVADRLALAGIVLHEMRAVLADLDVPDGSAGH